jgi:hypothetical protein
MFPLPGNSADLLAPARTPALFLIQRINSSEPAASVGNGSERIAPPNRAMGRVSMSIAS